MDNYYNSLDFSLSQRDIGEKNGYQRGMHDGHAAGIQDGRTQVINEANTTIRQLNKHVSDQDNEIAELKKRLAAKNNELAELKNNFNRNAVIMSAERNTLETLASKQPELKCVIGTIFMSNYNTLCSDAMSKGHFKVNMIDDKDYAVIAPKTVNFLQNMNTYSK
ncbi:hypothetical protein JE939_002873 [Yersinia ruckeri]|nr:hypothetical protein [Yersinia ruckeri]